MTMSNIFGDFFHDMREPLARQSSEMPQFGPFLTRYGPGGRMLDPNAPHGRARDGELYFDDNL
jgi:hypothetical protein